MSAEAATTITLWQCPECGKVINDLQRSRAIILDHPCGGCGRPLRIYIRVPRGQRPL